MRNGKNIIIMILFIILAGCSSSKIISTWKKPDAEMKNYNKILVIGVIRESDQSFREKMENHLTGDLKALGYNALSSLEQYGLKGFEKMDSQSAYKKLLADNFDAVLTIVLLDKKKEKYYVPARVINAPYNTPHSGLWNYYNSMLDRVDDKNYYGITTSYFWESNFYDLDKKELLYSVQTQSFDPVNTATLGHEYGLIIINNMVKSQVLAKQAGH